VTDDRNARGSWIAAAAALAFHAVNGLFAALMDRFPSALDELQHLSYVRAMEVSPSLFTRFEQLRVLDSSGARFSSAANYLSHPSPYYLLMGLFDRALGGSILGLRLVNLGLSFGAVAIMLAAGYRVLTGWRERAVFAAALVLFPKLGSVAGLINNDNGALLATAAAFFGLIEWQRRPCARTGALLGLGLALCGWTKLTVLVMAGLAVLIAEGLRLWSRKTRPGLGGYALVAVGAAVAAAPSLANILTYGRLLHQASPVFIEPAQRIALTPMRYTAVFLGFMADKWTALEPSDLLQKLGFLLVLGLGATAAAVGLRRMRREDDGSAAGPAWRAACAFILATSPMLLLHLVFGWRTYVEDGFVEAAQIRYYYGLWPGFALGLALLWRASAKQPFRMSATVVTSVLLVSSSLAFEALIMLSRGQTSIG
jgi:hypothetical protein